MNLIIENMYKRKSVRRFTEKQLSDEEIITIVEAGIQAPSGHNAQSAYYTIVQDRDLIDKMNHMAKAEMQKSEVDWIKKFGASERYHLLHNAPTVIIVSAKDDAYSPVEDSSAAIQNMLLAATSLGIGSVWIGLIKFFLHLDEAREMLNIKEGYTPLFAVCFGYENIEVAGSKPIKKTDVYEWIR